VEVYFFEDHIEYSVFDGNEYVLDDQKALFDAIEDFVDDDMDGVFEAWASPRGDAESLLAAYAADEQEWELGFHSAGTYDAVAKAARAAGLAVAPLVVDVKRA